MQARVKAYRVACVRVRVGRFTIGILLIKEGKQVLSECTPSCLSIQWGRGLSVYIELENPRHVALTYVRN